MRAVYSTRHGLANQVSIGIDEGLKHDSALRCDELVSLAKSRLTAFVGSLCAAKQRELDRAFAAALDLDADPLFELRRLYGTAARRRSARYRGDLASVTIGQLAHAGF